MSKQAHSLKPRKATSELRNTVRLDLRQSDGLRASIWINKSPMKVRLFDISPTGAGLIVPEERLPDLKVGSVVKLQFETPDQGDLFVKTKIRWKSGADQRQIKIGTEFVSIPGSNVVWPLDATYDVPEWAPITGAMYKPYLFYERAPIRIEKISKDMWQLRIYDSEILAIPGIKFDIYINSTAGSSIPIQVEFAFVDSSETNSVLVNVFPIDVPQNISEWIAQQLVFGGEVSPDTLRKIGFNISNLANGIRFRYIKTQEDYEQVLKLRYRAYSAVGKVAEGKSFLDMTAPLDSVSRIIAAYHGEKIVGTVAIAFPMSNDTVLDTERPFKNGYPRKMPPKTEVVEVARLCTDPEYRRGDLMIRILEHIYKALRCGNRKYVITSTDNKLWPLYKKLGFRKTGMSYDHPYLAGIKHHIITQSAKQGDLAVRINPLAWNYAWRDMSGYLEDNGTIQRRGWDRLRIRALTWIGRVLRINLKRKY